MTISGEIGTWIIRLLLLLNYMQNFQTSQWECISMAYLIRKGLQLICNHSLLGLDYVIELASQWVTSIIRSGQFHINVIVFVTTTRHQAPRHCRARARCSWTVPGRQLLVLSTINQVLFLYWNSICTIVIFAYLKKGLFLNLLHFLKSMF